jgi:hypothetical protein
MTVQILPDFLTADEVESLLVEFSLQSYTSEKTKQLFDKTIIASRYKNNHYNTPNSVVRQIVYPKLKNILGDHTMDSGSFLESHYPYDIHLDSHDTFSKKNFYSHTQNEINTSVLISLNEDSCFKTVFFDYFAQTLDLTKVPTGQEKHLDNHRSVDLSHLPEQHHKFIENLNITDVYHWKIGHAVLWPRTQLHASSNFYLSGKQKKAVVLFL